MLPPKSIEPYLSTSPKTSHSNSFTPPNVMKFHPEDTNHDTNGMIGIHRHNDMNGKKLTNLPATESALTTTIIRN